MNEEHLSETSYRLSDASSDAFTLTHSDQPHRSLANTQIHQAPAFLCISYTLSLEYFPHVYAGPAPSHSRNATLLVRTSVISSTVTSFPTFFHCTYQNLIQYTFTRLFVIFTPHIYVTP